MLEDPKAKLFREIVDEKRANLILSRTEKQMKKQEYMPFLVMIYYGEVKVITTFLQKIEFKILTLTN